MGFQYYLAYNQRMQLKNSPPIIATLVEDDELASLSSSHSAFVSVRATEALTANIDAVVISHKLLMDLSQDTALRTTLLGIARQHKPVLITSATLTDIAQQFALTLPEIQTETTQQMLASLVWEPDGIPMVSVLLISKDRLPSFGATELVAAITHQVASREATRAPSQSRTPASIVQSANTLFLPSITKFDALAPRWREVPRVSVEWDDCPYGLYRETLHPDWAAADQSDVYDFYAVRIVQQTIPGKVANPGIYPDCKDSGFRTSRLLMRADAYYRNQQLYAYGPTTTDGSTTASVNIGISAGDGGASVSLAKEWSFSIPFVRIRDRSDKALDRAEWEFIFDVNQDPANYVFLTEPRLTVSTADGMPLGITRRVNLYWNNGLGDVPRYDTWYYTITPTTAEVCRPSVADC